MRHNFAKSKLIGQKGEELFMKLYPVPLEHLDGRKGDFRVVSTGELLELKSDSYDIAKTANFFMERFSNFDRKTDGGPWQSLEHGADLWVYWYTTNLRAFVFNTKELVEFLDENLHKYQERLVQNERHTTVGYKVPRSELAHLYIEKDLASYV